MDGVCQESQKLGSPGEIQRESQRKFNDHIKLFYSITQQEPFRNLVDLSVVTLRTLSLIILCFTLLLPCRQHRTVQKALEEVIHVWDSVVSGDKISVTSSPHFTITCCVLGGKVPQWSRTQHLGSHRAVFVVCGFFLNIFY